MPGKPSRLADLIENRAPDSVALMTTGGVYIDYRPGFLESRALDPESIRGKSSRDVDPPDVAERAIAAIRDACETGDNVSFRYQRTFDDRVVERWALVVPVDGQSALVWFRDVSSEILTHRRNELESLLQAIPAVIVVCDASGTIRIVNSTAAEAFGYTADLLIGRPLGDILSGTRGGTGEGPERRMMTARSSDGREFAVAATIAPYDLEGSRFTIHMLTDAMRRSGVEAGAADTTEHFGSLFQSIPLPTFIWQRSEGEIRLVGYNEAGHRFTDGKVEHIVGIAASDYYADRPDVLQDLEICLERRSVFAREMDYETINLARVRMRVTYGYAEPDMIFVLVDDITEEHRLEKDLARKVRELGRATRKLREMSRAVVRAQEEERKQLALELHDRVAGQLTGLQLNIATMFDTDDRTAERERLLKITEELMYHVRSITTQLRPTVLDDLGLLEAVDAFCRRFASSGDFRVEWTANGSEGVEWSKEAEIAAYRIIQEAVTNAVKHASPSLISISIREEEGTAFIEIRDDGRGFAPDRAAPASGGHIGLEGMRERAAMLGGSVRIESARGEGTVVRVEIPTGT